MSRNPDEGKPVAPTLGDQANVLTFPEPLPNDLIDTYPSRAPVQSHQAVLAPLRELSGPLSERVKKSVTVLDFIIRYLGLIFSSNHALAFCLFRDDQHCSFSFGSDIRELEAMWEL